MFISFNNTDEFQVFLMHCCALSIYLSIFCLSVYLPIFIGILPHITLWSLSNVCIFTVLTALPVLKYCMSVVLLIVYV